jgi:ABC-2 type transport system permease protein
MTAAPHPLGILFRIATLSAWRRLLSLREQSKLLVALIGTFLIGYATMAFLLFYHGLEFLFRFPGLGGLLVERLLFLLFACLFSLLLISNLVIGYTNLFRNRETSYLIPLPIPTRIIFQWKFAESVMLASWAFMFLIAPLLAAYGMVNHVAWHFYPATLALVALFIVLPGVGGSFLAITLARHLDRKAFQMALLIFLFATVGLLLAGLRSEPITEEMLETRVMVVIDRLLDKTRFVNWRLLPSYWLSASVQHWSEGAMKSAIFFALVLLSNALFFGSIAVRWFGGVFYEASNVVHSRGSIFVRWAWFQRLEKRRSLLFNPRDWLDAILSWNKWLPTDVRALVAKDLRVFWRDTTQWGQTLMLFGLLAIYLVNLRHFTRQLDSAFWISLVSFLNLGACSLNLATLTTRFVFPQFSLEGRRIWLIGLAPLGIVRVVLLKFLLASITTLVLTLSLTLLSCGMLHLGAPHTIYFAMAIVVMTFTLNAIAVGLGALYPNFKETNPNKIVSGFGGTFCLVLSFLYILLSVLGLAIGSPWGWRGDDDVPSRALFTWTVFVLSSFLAAWLPLRLGMRRAATMEL